MEVLLNFLHFPNESAICFQTYLSLHYKEKFPLAFNLVVHLFLFALWGKETSRYLFYTL